MLFAAGIYNILEDVKSSWKDVWSVWYLDDGSIAGRVQDLNAVLSFLEQRLAQVGLVVNFDKCHILSAIDSLHSYSYLNRIQRHDSTTIQ